MKNEVKEQIRPTVTDTRATIRVLPQNSVPRRGWLVRDVRIMPVLYSAVRAMAPKTTITSWPRNRTDRAFAGQSLSARSLPSWFCDAAMANRALRPMVMTMVTSSVQNVERTVRILVHSECTAALNVALAWGKGFGP